jgi:competence protein ComEA
MRQSPGQHQPVLVWVIVALIAVVGGGFVVFVLINQPSRNAAPVEPTLDPLMQPVPTPQTTPTPQDVVVYISGAVQQPDVYALPHDARIKDVVLAAGGFLEDADSEQVNLAARIEDEQHIHIPHIGEAPPPADQRGGSSATGPQTQDDTTSSLIDLNQASQAELEELPGVGQVTAQRIMEYRQANGPFTSVDDIQNVTGIGPALFEQISPLVTVGE